MIFKFNRLLSEKEKNMIMDAYNAGFEEGFRVASGEITDFVKRYCEKIKKGDPLAENEEMSDSIIIYNKMAEDRKKFLKEMETKNEKNNINFSS